jgi:hypothetical protein
MPESIINQPLESTFSMDVQSSEFQLPINEASENHISSLASTSTPSPPMGDDTVAFTKLNPLILLEDTMFAPDERATFIDTPSLFGLGILQKGKLKDALLTIPEQSQYQDLNGYDEGNGYFHGINKPGKGQGLQYEGEDLHVAMLKGKKEWNQKSEYQHLPLLGDRLNPPMFNVGEEPGQDPENPIFDTIHEESLLAPRKEDLDLNGEEGKSFDLGRNSGLHNGYSLEAEYHYQHGNTKGIAGPVPSKSPYQDLDGKDGGQGYFHITPNPTKYQGRQIQGVDLHEHLLETPYTYTHGLNTANIKPSATNKDNFNYQDLDIDIRNTTPTQYINNLPR